MLNQLPVQVKPCDDVISQKLEDQVVLLNLSSQEYYGLDEIGTCAWTYLIENGNVEDAFERLCGTYSGDRSAIRNDFHSLLSELIEAGLLKEC